MIASRREATALLLAALVFGGCAAPPPRPEAQIAPGVAFKLPSPGELGYSISAQQLVIAHYRDETQTFEASLSVSGDSETLIGFDPFGRRAFTASLNGGAVSLDRAPGLPMGLPAGNILADVAIVYWPDRAVKRGLPPSAELHSGDAWRTIEVAGREIIRVDYDTPLARGWPKNARYRNEAFGYALDLESTVDSR